MTVAANAPMGDDGWRWIELKFPGADTALHFVHRSDTAPHFVHRRGDAPSNEPVLVFVDANPAATVARLKAGGVEIVSEPQEAPWQPGRTVAEFRDSEGNRVVLGTP